MKLAEKKLHEIELECGARPVVVMESTSHYHLILFQFFTDAGFEVVVVNPIQSGYSLDMARCSLTLEEVHRAQFCICARRLDVYKRQLWGRRRRPGADSKEV